MPQKLRPALLLLALVLCAPALAPSAARAADVPAAVDVRVPKPLIEWVKKNATTLYLVFDEIMDDLTGGCDCPPPPTPPYDPPPPW
jgi:hypothetical protein